MAGLQCALFIISFALFVLFSSATALADIENTFLTFINNYQKTYVNGTDEFYYRLSIFEENLRHAESLNRANGSHGEAVFGVTKFSDLTKEEFSDKYLNHFHDDRLHRSTSLKFRPEPQVGKVIKEQRLDWRDFGAVSPVKNQGHCGACWAFASAEVVESAYAIKHNLTGVPDLSVQQLIDCSKSKDGSNDGCEGGSICDALNYVLVDGITYDSVYPLIDKDGMCMPVPSGKSVHISGYSCDSYLNKEEEILSLLSTRGPVAVAVDATTWNNYVGGIIRYHCEANINHAVDIVGYDLTGPVPYYIVRNSWGTDFGIAGYLYIEVGKNLCGIAEGVSTVSITDKPQPD